MGLEEFYGELELEPLSWTLDYIAEQTDEQILFALWAAHKRAEELQGRKRISPSELFDPDKATEDEQKAQMISLGMMLGLSQDAIQAQWTTLNPDKSPIEFPKTVTIPDRFPDFSFLKQTPRQQGKTPNKNLIVTETKK